MNEDSSRTNDRNDLALLDFASILTGGAAILFVGVLGFEVVIARTWSLSTALHGFGAPISFFFMCVTIVLRAIHRRRTLTAILKNPAWKENFNYRSIVLRTPPETSFPRRLRCLFFGHRWADYGGTLFTAGHVIRCHRCGAREDPWTKRIRASYVASVGGPDKARAIAERSEVDV